MRNKKLLIRLPSGFDARTRILPKPRTGPLAILKLTNEGSHCILGIKLESKKRTSKPKEDLVFLQQVCYL